MDEEFHYEAECDLCGTTQELIVIDIDERPNFCCMCGTELLWDQ
jgi:hypothetical protein